MNYYRMEDGNITPPPEQFPKVDIIIVGAGLSGLVSAKKIKEKERSLHVKILEATNTVGGQITSTYLGELGGKWVTEEQLHIKQLLEQLRIPLNKRTVVAPALQRCWDLDRGLFAPMAKYELRRYIKELELKVALFKPGRIRIRKHTRNMYDHICNRLFFSKSRQFMLNLVQLISGVDARDISFKEFMTICYGCGGLQKVIDIYIECPKTLLEIPSAHLLKALVERLQFSEFLFFRKVQEIRHYKDYVEIVDSEDEMHTADAVILAIPWNCIQEIRMTPPFPADLYKLRSTAQTNSIMITSFIAQYNGAYWRDQGYSGNFLSNNPIIFGHEYRNTAYCGLTLHEEGLESAVRALTLNKLAEQFGDQMLMPFEYHQRTFRASSLQHAPFTTPWNRIIWSSSASASTCYRGFLGGAVQSGLRAAMNALLVVRPQAVTFNDVAEVQCARGPSDKQIGLLELWMSELNLYNVTYYSLFVYGVFTVLQYMYKKPN